VPSFLLNRFLTVVTFALVAGAAADAQVAPSVTGTETHLWAGGEYSRFQSDYHVTPGAFGASDNGNYKLSGLGVYANLGIHGRFSLEGEARFLDLNSLNGETEKTFLLGPSARIYQRGHLTLNGKFLGGAGLIHFPFDIGYGSYFAFAPAGNIEYRLGRKFKARAEYEYVFQPSAPGLPDLPSNGVNPHGFSLGLAYRIF
jgi:hypothetical protein